MGFWWRLLVGSGRDLFGCYMLSVWFIIFWYWQRWAYKGIENKLSISSPKPIGAIWPSYMIFMTIPDIFFKFIMVTFFCTIDGTNKVNVDHFIDSFLVLIVHLPHRYSRIHFYVSWTGDLFAFLLLLLGFFRFIYNKRWNLKISME